MIQVVVKSSASVESVEFLDSICEKTLIQANFEEWRSISFAVHEMIINGIEATKRKYNENAMNKSIILKIYVKEDEIEIHVEDEGDGIKEGYLEKINQLGFEDILNNENGRGLLLIRQFVDKVWYEIEEKHTVKICKRRRNHDR